MHQVELWITEGLAIIASDRAGTESRPQSLDEGGPITISSKLSRT